MSLEFTRIQRILLWALPILLLITFPSQGQATSLVLPGYSLFETIQPTTFGGASFVGVPLATFNFGSGTVSVGPTDTIIHRLDSATTASPSISVQMVALHLMSATPVDLGLGTGIYFMTLQSERGGPASTGRMTINFGPEPPPGGSHGTFDSFFDVFFDIRLGALNGPVAMSGQMLQTSTGTQWTHEPPPGTVLINGVNTQLNSTDVSNDFHILGNVQQITPTGPLHSIRETRVPEPDSLTLLWAGGLTAGLVVRLVGRTA